MNLQPVPSASATCANCGAALVSDQRYCLACGHPVSPVRLAFLDVLQSEREAPGAALVPARAAYAPALEPAAGPAWLRRYAPLFAVLSVLLLAMIAGLLIGHWVTQNKPPAQQVLKVEGLSAAPAAAGAAPTTSTAASSTPSSNAARAKEEAEEAKEAKAEKAAPLAKPVPVSPAKVQKLSTSTGKKHQEEVNKLGNAPIETGGGGGSSPAPSSSESSKPAGGGSPTTSIE